MKPDKNKKADESKSENIAPDYEQNGRQFSEEEEIKPGEGLLHHGRPLSEMEIEELQIHKENNEFLGISDTPEAGAGGGNAGGIIPDADDLEHHTNEIIDNGIRDSNFGRNYQGGNQSQDHFIEENSEHEHKEKKD